MDNINLLIHTNTLGLSDNTIIATIAIVPFIFGDSKDFDYYVNNGLLVKFNCAEQLDLGRIIDDDTFSWWMSLPEEIQRMNIKRSKHDQSIEDGVNSIIKYVRDIGFNYDNGYVWGYSDFIFPKMKSIFKMVNKPLPYKHTHVCDIRTYIHIFSHDNDYNIGEIVNNKITYTKHNTLHDAAKQTLKMVMLYDKLNN